MDINKILKDDDASSINEEQLGSLTKAAADLVAKQREIDACAAKLKELNAEARKISEKDIPELMDNLGVDKITLKDGHVITVADSVQCSIPATVRPGA